MGRQTQLHFYGNDIRNFVHALWARCDLVVTRRCDDQPAITPVADPRLERSLTLWNRDLQTSLSRTRIQLNSGGEWFCIDNHHQVLELTNSIVTTWDGRPALVQGRIYGSDFTDRKDYGQWMASTQRWLRRHFRKCPSYGGFVGPEAWRFFESGGLLLPGFAPPVTPAWLNDIAKQDAIRHNLAQPFTG